MLPVQTNRTTAELVALTITDAGGGLRPAGKHTELHAGESSRRGPDRHEWRDHVDPGEAQGPGTNLLETIVTDNGVPPLSATNSFTVIVTEANALPILPVQTNRTVFELSSLVVTNAASDPDLPANVLTYSLLNPPAGAQKQYD